MADVLSQSEIDALLSALSTGELEPDELHKEEEKHKVKVYDFKSPQKFSKEHIRTLEMVHDGFARSISTYLTAHLRKNVKVKVQSVEQITYEEFIHSIQNPTVMTMFKMPPFQGTLLLETNPQFSFQIIDVLMGGNGERNFVSKEFSDIDKNIMLQVTSGIIANLKLAWEDVLEVHPEVEGLETNPALSQTLAPNEPVALINLIVEIGKMSTFINMCIPYLSIEKLIDKLVVQYWFKNENEFTEETRIHLEKGLEKVSVGISAELGSSSITIDEFLQLGCGDVIKLDRQAKSPITVFVENQETYYAKPGIVGKNLGIAILDIIDKDVESDE